MSVNAAACPSPPRGAGRVRVQAPRAYVTSRARPERVFVSVEGRFGGEEGGRGLFRAPNSGAFQRLSRQAQCNALERAQKPRKFTRATPFDRSRPAAAAATHSPTQATALTASRRKRMAPSAPPSRRTAGEGPSARHTLSAASDAEAKIVLGGKFDLLAREHFCAWMITLRIGLHIQYYVSDF